MIIYFCYIENSYLCSAVKYKSDCYDEINLQYFGKFLPKN